MATFDDRRSGARAKPPPSRLAQAPMLVSLLLPLAIIVLIVLQLRAEWRRLLDEVEINTQTMTHILAEHTDRLLGSADLVRLQTEALVGHENLEATDFGAYLQLRRIVETVPHVVSIWVGDADGTAVLTSREFPAPALDAADRDYFTVVRDDPEALYVGNLPDNRYADQVLINTSRRMSDALGGFRGFVQVALAPDWIEGVFRRVWLVNQASLWWLGPDGRPLMREPYVPLDRLEALLPEGMEAIEGADGGSFRGRSRIDGSDQLYFFTRSAEYGNVILIGIDRAALVAMWWQRALPTLALGTLLVTAVVVILGFVWRAQSRTRSYARELEGAVAARTRDLEEAMAQKDLILQEMRHRVGNAYATIQSLSQQMLRSSDDLESFRATFPGRLRALAATQTMLVEAEDRRASVEDLVWIELGPYRPRGSPGTEVSGPAVTLDARRAVAAGLVLHELVTNAVKHGALSVPEGGVKVRWRLDRGRLILHWKEHGGPRVAGAREEGFGSGMLRRATALIEGTIEVRHPPDGVEAELVLPL
jgi:two-component sensor histidine kinase